MSVEISYNEAIIESLPDLVLCIPGLAFSDKFTLYGKKHDVELISFQNGHTGSDTVLYMPSGGIGLMSDLLFVGSHPVGGASGELEN